MMLRLAHLSFFNLLIGTVQSFVNLTCISSPCTVPGSTLRFMTIGDWGGLEVWPFTTIQQTRVAERMGELASEKGADFVLSVGDNFYFHGVSLPTSHRFQDTFEEVYSSKSLENVPWYLVAGNHDHYGNAYAQVQYSNQSARWRYPDMNYNIQYRLNESNTLVEFVMMDTIVMCGNTKSDIRDKLYQWFTWAEDDDQPKGPEDVRASKTAWKFLEERLSQSRADYLFVIGHFPIWSISNHGPTQCLVNKLNPLLKKYKASAYLCGHDHNLQHLVTKYKDEENNKSESEMHYFLSGLGAYTDSTTVHQNSVPANSSLFFYPRSTIFGIIGAGYGGFMYTSLDNRSATFSYVRSDGVLLHQAKVYPRKKF